jgi:hypothetical protein
MAKSTTAARKASSSAKRAGAVRQTAALQTRRDSALRAELGARTEAGRLSHRRAGERQRGAASDAQRSGLDAPLSCRMGLEGIVSKQIDKAYAPDNRGIWVKAKCRPRQEFIIIGWTNSDNGIGFGALLRGYFDDDNNLAYAGRCGSGLSGQ